MIITIDDLEVDEPIIPKRLGLCGNFIGAFDVCGKAVMDDDDDSVELPMKNNHRQFICGACCNKILQPRGAIIDVEKPEKAKSHKKGRTGARLSTGPGNK